MAKSSNWTCLKQVFVVEFQSGIEQLAARKAHNLEVPGSNPGPATKKINVTFLPPILWFVFRKILERGWVAQLVERGTHKPEVVGSKPTPATNMGPWCSPVNTSPCHGEDRRFESGRTRHKER